MFPSNIAELSHVEELDGINYYVTVDQKVGALFSILHQDIESSSGPTFEAYLGRIKPGVLVRFISSTEFSRSHRLNVFRLNAMSKIGWTESNLLIAIETKPQISSILRSFLTIKNKSDHSDFESEISHLNAAADLEGLLSLGAVSLNASEIEAHFQKQALELAQSSTGAHSGCEHIGVIRLWKQAAHPIDRHTVAYLRQQIQPPFEIVVNVTKVSDMRAQYLLRRKRAQLLSSNDSLNSQSLDTATEATEETLLAGKSLVNVEWLLILRRLDEATLKADLAQSLRTLSQIGDVMVEVEGVGPSLAAASLGGNSHHSFLELHDKATAYLPTQIEGEPNRLRDIALGALPLHRIDGSVYFFDLWAKGYDGANCIINGRRGKGKSVLANLISSSLLHDERVRLIKVDVGGSYTKECELFGGNHIQFNLSEPSGLNPFQYLTQTDYREDAAMIITEFLSTLILESKETSLTKEMQGDLERAVLQFCEQAGTTGTQSLDGFLSFSADIPRLQLLKRFAKGGVFANVLSSTDNDREPRRVKSRYTYYNFERLQNAANEDFSQAVMAAVIAEVNLEVLVAGDAKRGNANRVVFFADETPFFIQKNGRFFKLTTANFRKFGHGTILIAQTTKDFELTKSDGSTDYGILINSPIRFFYQVDDTPEVFRDRFGLTDLQIQSIQNLGKTEAYREVFLQDELGGRVLRVQVTPEEYWQVTSSRNDNERIQALLRAVPNLKLKEAIQCLSITG